MNKFNTLEKFTAEVNSIFALQIGRNPNFPQRMFVDEFNSGKTPKQVVNRMNREAEAEFAAEARMS